MLLVMFSKVLNLQPPHYAQDSSQGIQIPKGFFFNFKHVESIVV